MDIDTECIPLGHIQTYFDLRKGIQLEYDWLKEKSRLSEEDFANHDSILELITGIDESEFYRNANIPYQIGEAGRFISARQTIALVEQGIEAFEMPYLGLVMGNLMTISHHGMAGIAAVTQPTLRGCLEAIQRYCEELFPPLHMDGVVGEEEAYFSISENIDLTPYTHFFMELNMVSFYNIFQHLMSGDHELFSADFSYPEPSWGHIYRRYFQCPVRFDQPMTRLRGPRELEHYELPLANRMMAISAEKTLFENIPTRAMRLLPLRLRRLLVRYYGAFPSMEKVASELGMSGRTLRRKLAEEGTSFQKELDMVRERLAREYFAKGGESTTEIAMMLGFADSSAFAKSFRRWTNMSPGEYREHMHR